jgi:hypothetical protein
MSRRFVARLILEWLDAPIGAETRSGHRSELYVVDVGTPDAEILRLSED